jgi:hypothetical protein
VTRAVCCSVEAERAWKLPPPPRCNHWLSSRAKNSCDWPTCLKRRLHSLPIMRVHPTQKDDVHRLCNSCILLLLLFSLLWGVYSVAIQTQDDQYPCTVQVFQLVHQIREVLRRAFSNTHTPIALLQPVQMHRAWFVQVPVVTAAGLDSTSLIWLFATVRTQIKKQSLNS